MDTINDYSSDGPIPGGTCVVIGGGGFVGRWLVLRLLQLRKWVVRVADSSPSLHLDPSSPLDSVLSQAISTGRASYHSLDLRRKLQIAATIEGSAVVYFLDVEAAHDPNFYICYMNIVRGAKNVIEVCRGCKVKRLIYYSSADVVFDGSCDVYNATESMPYPLKYNDMWSELKAQAEALILFANDIDGLLTCTLRPSNVFGPGEMQFMPFLIKLAKSGGAKFIVGTGENKADFTYVDNVTHALICAEEALDSKSVSVAGKAFFVTNSEPMKFWKFVSLLLEGLGYERPLIKLPVVLVHYILSFGEWLQKELGVIKHNHMRSSHYIVSLASRVRTFDTSAAEEQIGYEPVVTLEEGISRTVESFSHLVRDPLYMERVNLTEQSKADKLLGSGKVADLLLWRDEKTTFTCFLSLVLLYYWFFLTGRTFISSVALLLLMITIVSLGYGYLSSDICGSSVPVPPSACFEMEESIMRESIRSIVYVWNRGIRVSRLLARGKDWNIFLKSTAYLCFLKYVVAHHLTTALGAALVFSFTSFFIYEQYEVEVDAVMKVALNRTRKLKGQVLRYLPLRPSSHRHRHI